MKKWLSLNRIDLLAWIFCIVLLGWILWPLLTDRVTPGWDTTPHFYLFNKMVEYLKAGRITGYDSLWFGGFPAFEFYGPLPYIIMSIPYFLSGGLIGLPLSFNLFLFALPFLFLASIYFTARVWFGKTGGPIAMIFGLFFLVAVHDKAHAGVGLNSIISIGLFSSFFAICLMILFLGIIRKQVGKPEVKNLLMGSMLLAMLIMTHAMTLLFTLVLLAIFTLMNWKKFCKSAVVMGLCGAILSSFWLIPFLSRLNFSSGQKLGIAGMAVDPLFVLFDFPSYYGENAGSLLMSTIPVLLFLVSSLIGVIISVKNKNAFWAFSFLATLIVLPREYLVWYLDLPIHYYRYMAHIYVLNIFLATAGLIFLFERMSRLRTVRQQIGRGVLSGIVIVSLLVSGVDALNLSGNPRNYEHKYNFDDYGGVVAAEQAMDYLGKAGTRNRVVVPVLPRFQDTLGSPHFFDTFLPLKYKIPVLPGLLAESALSTQFVLPVISSLGNSINWGNASLIGDPEFNIQNANSMIRRLELYNVQYVLLTSDFADRLLANTDKKLIKLDRRIGIFSILELTGYRPVIEATNYQPFLFIDNGGMSFLEFSREWFKIPELFEMPVIYTEKSLDELPQNEIENMGGYIVSMPGSNAIPEKEYDKWIETGKKVFFLDSSGGGENGMDFVLSKLPGEVREENIIRKAIVPEFIDDMKIRFNSSGGTLINYSYFPRWRSIDREQTIYWATPSMMWVFGRGETTIEYD